MIRSRRHVDNLTGQLGTFVNELAAQSGKMVPPDLADAWTAQAEEIMLLLEC